jgi:rhamnosyltransferase
MKITSRKRFAICSFYNANGHIENYCFRLLKAVKEQSRSILLVSNTKLDAGSKSRLTSMNVDYIERTNTGLDFGAWKAGIDFLGWNVIDAADDLLLFNFTCYGPLTSLSPVFEQMDTSDCDFWGITSHPASEDLIIFSDPDTQPRYHIQTYFINFKKSCFTPLFKDFWNNLKEYSNYLEEVAYHENLLTEKLSLSGLKPQVLIEQDCNETMFRPYQLIREKNSPFLKRKIFFIDYQEILLQSFGSQATQALNFIESNYPDIYEEIIDDLLSNKPLSALKNNIHWNYLINPNAPAKKSTFKAGVVMFVFYDELLNFNLRYLRNIPNKFKIYICSSKPDLAKQYVAELKESGYSNLEIIECPKKGRDIGAFLISAKKAYLECDILCYLHDKKTAHASSRCAGEDFAAHCFDNILPSKEYAESILHLFTEHQRLGLLVPPPPNYSIDPLGIEMGKNKSFLHTLFDWYKISVPFDKAPLAPFGSMFWVRCKPFAETLSRYNLTLSDLPDEPLPTDGSISHALERLFPTLLQEQKFFTGWLINTNYAQTYINNSTFLLRRYNLMCLDIDYLTSTVRRQLTIESRKGLTTKDDHGIRGLRRKSYRLLKSIKLKILGSAPLTNRTLRWLSKFLRS